MRSSHSSHRSSMSRSHRSSMSHRSSFSHSHHSSMSKRNGFGGIRHNSMHRSSLSGMHKSSHSSMHRSSLSRRASMGKMISRKSSFKHNGISDAHAFAVGKATGVNINGSARGAHGAALHRSRARRNARYTSSAGFKSTQSNMSKRRIKFSRNSNRSRRYKFDPIKNNLNIEIPLNNYSKYIGIFTIIFMIFFVIMVIIMASSFTSIIHHPFLR